MADPQRPWSNDEKNFVLAEIIKQQSPPPNQLYGLLTTVGRAEPRWEDMPLPAGRTLNQCRLVFEDIRRAQSQQPQPPPAFMTGSYGLETPRSAPAAASKRPFYLLDAPPGGRQIRPKPTVASGPIPPAAASEPAPKRKRGRPTKAQAQAKAAAEAATAGRGEAGPALRPITPGQAQAAAPAVVPAPSATTLPAEEPRPTLQAPARMQISAVLTPTNPNTASSSSSSSGRRRRGRSTRSDQGGMGEGFGGSIQQYESPYGRAAEPMEDTLAQTARMRHREELQAPPAPPQAQRPDPATTSYEQGGGPATEPPPSTS